VAAGEDQPELVIGNHARLTGRGVLLLVQADELGEAGGAVSRFAAWARPKLGITGQGAEPA
jgi:hypothetical protein